MPFKFDANNNLDVNLAAGSISGGNAAAGTTGTPVPANADYQGVNVGGTLVGVTGFTVGSSTGEAVAIIDGSGNQITSFGGGTQFADNAASGATPTGTLEMGWDSGNSKVRALKVDASQNLNVNVAASTTVPVSGTFFQATQPVSIAATVAENLTQVGGSAVTLGAKTSANSIPVVLASDEAALHTIVDSGSITANAGTNLNTSALLLDATFTGRINTQGQKAMAASTPVVLASDQSSIPVTGTFFQGTQPVSIAAAVDVSDRSARLLGHVTVDSAPTTAVTQSTSPWVVSGSKTTNNAAPIADNIGALVAVAKAGAPTYTEGDQVLLSTDLSGNLRISGTIQASNPAVGPTGSLVPTQASYTAAKDASGTLVGMNVDQFGNLSSVTPNSTQVTDLLQIIVAQLKLLNMNLASSMPSAYVDSDTSIIDTFSVN